ncbi:hypothetical protein BpHYR1_002029 [Brachionus plicatilis]|uniref:Uncharacterized protein n=1 Tax=Brachionus plicatilis TaxID=10195 RepID=A0A3M7RAS3_BRAPC|nr:hypothetical protein BpHYR1_002029 [Brachionus plicatilis]
MRQKDFRIKFKCTDDVINFVTKHWISIIQNFSSVFVYSLVWLIDFFQKFSSFLITPLFCQKILLSTNLANNWVYFVKSSGGSTKIREKIFDQINKRLFLNRNYEQLRTKYEALRYITANMYGLVIIDYKFGDNFVPSKKIENYFEVLTWTFFGTFKQL